MTLHDCTIALMPSSLSSLQLIIGFLEIFTLRFPFCQAAAVLMSSFPYYSLTTTYSTMTGYYDAALPVLVL